MTAALEIGFVIVEFKLIYQHPGYNFGDALDQVFSVSKFVTQRSVNTDT